MLNSAPCIYSNKITPLWPIFVQPRAPIFIQLLLILVSTAMQPLTVCYCFFLFLLPPTNQPPFLRYTRTLFAHISTLTYLCCLCCSFTSHTSCCRLGSTVYMFMFTIYGIFYASLHDSFIQLPFNATLRLQPMGALLKLRAMFRVVVWPHYFCRRQQQRE